MCYIQVYTLLDKGREKAGTITQLTASTASTRSETAPWISERERKGLKKPMLKGSRVVGSCRGPHVTSHTVTYVSVPPKRRSS